MMSAAGADDEPPVSVWIGNLPHGVPISSLIRLCDECKLGMPIYSRAFHGNSNGYSSAILKFSKTEHAVEFLNFMQGRECWDRYPPMIVKFARQHDRNPPMMPSTAPTTPSTATTPVQTTSLATAMPPPPPEPPKRTSALRPQRPASVPPARLLLARPPYKKPRMMSPTRAPLSGDRGSTGYGNDLLHLGGRLGMSSPGPGTQVCTKSWPLCCKSLPPTLGLWLVQSCTANEALLHPKLASLAATTIGTTKG